MDPLALTLPDNAVGGTLLRPIATPRALVACIHGGGCHSGYFDSGEASLTRALLTTGYQVLLVDRPGTRNRPLLDAERPLAASVGTIAAFIAQVWQDHGAGAPIALLGHSIGGALALAIAAEGLAWPLAAVLVSGIGDEPPPLVVAWPTGRDMQAGALSTEAASFFLGPEGTYDWRGLTRLRKVAAPWNVAERMEVVCGWPALWRELAPCITVPVQLRLADGERIWMTGDHVAQRMAAALTRAPHVDAAVLPEGGHLYDFHKRGPELTAAQIAFLDAVVPVPSAVL